MAFVEYDLACPKCDSSDAYAIDEKGWGKCFSCGANVPPQGSSVSHNEHDSGRVVPLKTYSSLTDALRSSKDIIYRSLPERKLSAETCKHYGVGYVGSDLVFPFGSDNQAYKVRMNGEKKFRIDGDFKNAPELFGQNRFSGGGKIIL